MKRLGPALTVVAALVLAQPAIAGPPQSREGFWIGFGLGYGSADLGQDYEGGQGAFTGSIRMGWTVGPQVLLGVESNLWFKEDATYRDYGTNPLTLGSVTAMVTFYPARGWFLKAGPSLWFVDFGSVSYPTNEKGWGFLMGTGYDIRMGKSVSLTPSVSLRHGTLKDVFFHPSYAGDVKVDMFTFELGLTFH